MINITEKYNQEKESYIGRSFIGPVSLIVGGYVKELRAKAMIESCLNNMNPPIAIDDRI